MQEQTAIPSSSDYSGNRLLAKLPREVLHRLSEESERVLLPAGGLLATAGQPVRTVYFPIDSVMSLVHTDVDGTTIQVGMVGPEGMLGIGACLNGMHGAGALVLAAGQAYKLSARLVRDLFNADATLRDVLLVYASVLLGQAWQIAICNRHHPPERQLCTLLLLVLDRSPRAELAMTHDLIARLIGVRRETVSQAAMRIQERGYVRYSRGHIRVLDRAGLERQACGCYLRQRVLLSNFGR
jgi:CRP-like cAMP-binding protein